VNRLRELDVRVWIGGLIVVVILAALVISLVDSGGSDESSSEGAVALSESDLLSQADTLEHPAYWVGPRPGTSSYELTSTPDGRIYIRYLTGEAQAGAPQPNYLTVGTYSIPDARKALRKAKKDSAGSEKLSRHEGYEVLDGSSGYNVYVVFDNQPDLQVEVFSPEPGEAAELAASGSIKPLG
jgi:hypothetical protein